MAVIHVTEAAALQNFATVLDHVRAGSEVVIDGESEPVALLLPRPDAGP